MRKVLSLLACCWLIGSAHAQDFNEWLADGAQSQPYSIADDGSAIVEVTGAGNAWDFEFCAVLHDNSGQRVGNSFTFEFDVLWESASDEDETSLGLLTGKNYVGGNELHDEWQWNSEVNTELIFPEGFWAQFNKQITVTDNQWVHASWGDGLEIGDKGEDWIGIQINLGQTDGSSKGTFHFKNMTITMGNKTYTWFEERVAYVDGDFYYDIEDGNAVLIGNKKAASTTEITIPQSATIEGQSYPVAKIDNNAFKGLQNLTTVNIPASVTIIRNSVFSGCANLTSIVVDASNEIYSSDGGVLFNKTKSHIVRYPIAKSGAYTIPASVQSVGEGAFLKCTGLTSVVIQESVTYIDNGAFEKCSNLTTVTYPETVHMGSGVFTGCPISIINGKYAYLFPTSGTTTVDLTSKSDGYTFNMYDDGGPFSTYTGRNGNIVLQAAAGKSFFISGLIDADRYNNPYVKVYNGDINNDAPLLGTWGNGGIAVVTGNIATLEFYGAYGNNAPGLDLIGKLLTVAVVEDGFAYADNTKTTLVAYVGEEKVVTIPANVTTITSGAFNTAKVVMIPSTVTTIAANAFSNANGLQLFCAVTEANKPAGWADGWAADNSEITWGTTELPDFVYNITGTSPKTVELVSCNSTDANIVIPATVEIDGETYTDTYIANEAFAGNTTMTSVTIPSGITGIAGNAFTGCFNLATVNFNATHCSSVGEWVSGYAFGNSSNITTVNFGDNVEYIPNNAFSNCSGLTSITIPNSVTTIDYSAFASCSNLTEVTLGNSVANIYSDVFFNCGITTVDIPASVSYIEPSAFAANTLTSINVDAQNQTYKSADGVLYSKDGKTLVACPRARAGAMVIPETVETIGGQAFEFCRNLTSVTLGSNVKTIKYNAFNSSSLTEITIPASVTSIGDAAFAWCGNLLTVNYNATNCTQMGSAWANVFSGSSIKKLSIGSNVRSIPALAFSGCSSLDLVEIPATVETIGEDAFYYVNAISYSGEAEGSPWGALRVITGFIDGDFAYADNTKKVLVAYIGTASDVSIPSTVETIGAEAFSGCSTLASVSIPNTVTKIGVEAFYGCHNLASVRIPSSVTSIGQNAFGDCYNMMIATIPQQVNAIGYGAFSCNAQIYCEAENRPDGWNANWRECESQWNTHWGEQPSGDYGTVEIVCSSKPDPNTIEELPTAIEYIVEAAEKVQDPWDQQFFISLTPQHALVEGEQYRFSFEVKADIATNVTFAIQGQADNGDFIMWDVFGRESEQTFTTSYRTYVYTGTVTPQQAGIYCFAINLNDYAGANTYYFRNIVFEELYIPEREEFECGVLDEGARTAFISKYNGKGGNVEIPSTVKIDGVDYTVASISPNAFKNGTTITSVNIPNTVKVIGENAFDGCRNMTEITIPDSVTNIECSAFANCNKLTTVYFNAKDSWVCSSAFNNSGMKTLVVGDNVKRIQNNAFSGCSTLEQVTIGNSVTTIGWNAFSECSNLEQVTIGNSVTDIGYAVFRNCENLQTINIPASVTNMSSDVFYGCFDATITCELAAKPFEWNNNWNQNGGEVVWGNVPLPVFRFSVDEETQTAQLDRYYGTDPEVEIPATATIGGKVYNVTSIGDYVFGGNQNIVSVVIGENVETIGRSSFSGCNNLMSVTLGESVKTIGNEAFYGCNNISEITIPSSVTNINAMAFYWSGLKYIRIPNTVTNIGSCAFYNPNGVMNIYCECAEDAVPDGWNSGWNCGNLAVTWGTTSIPEFAWQYNDNEQTANLIGYYGSSSNVVIPDTITQTVDGEEVDYTVVYISDRVFQNNSSVETISIPATVTDISWQVFDNCKNLAAINVDTANNYFMSEEGVLYTKNQYSLVAYPAGKTDTLFEVPTEVSAINFYAFHGNSYLKHVIIPAGGISIIIDGTFKDCSSLQTIEVPEGVTYIGDYAFQNCSSLQSVELPSTITNISSYCFDNCSSLQSIVIPEGVTSIAYGVFQKCSSLQTVELPSSVTSVHSNAFAYCTNLEEINIPASVEQMDWDVFYDSRNVTINCEVSRKPGGWDAGWNDGGGTVVWGTEVLPDFVYTITDAENHKVELIRYNGANANVTIPAKVEIDGVVYDVTSIGEQAFYYNRNITSVVFEQPSLVTQIGESAFESCTKLKSIELPSGLARIENNAFYYCYNLESIELPSSLTYIGGYAFYDCKLTDLQIPASAEIAESAFYSCDYLRTVIIPASVISVGGQAFAYSSENATIVCLGSSKPSGWSDDWDDAFDGTVIWNAKKITLEASPNTMGSVSGSGWYSGDSNAEIVATPNVGCKFSSWKVNDVVVSNLATYSYPVTADVTIVANFEQEVEGYFVAATANNAEYGTVTGGGAYPANATAALTATPNDGYGFLGWYQGENLYNAQQQIQVNADITLVAKFTPVYGLWAGVDQGSGTVYASVNDGEEGQCYSYSEHVAGTKLSLRAEPSTGYYFNGWSNGETNQQVEFNINSDVVWYACFPAYTYEINVASNNEDYGTVIGDGTYEYSESITLRAIPAEGCTFTGWSDGENIVSIKKNYSFEVYAPVDLTAIFEINNYAIAVAANNAQYGLVTGANTYNHGANVALTATANTGYHFAGWVKGAETEYVSTSANYSFTATEAATLTAVFEPDSYAITIAAANTNGTVSGSASGTYNYGEELTVVATPATGYHFTGWSNGTSVVSNDAEYTFAASAAVSLTAGFAIDNYTVTINKPENGTITGGTSGKYDYGTVLNLVATPADGYQFVHWTDDAEVKDATRSYTVTGEASFTAMFTKNTIVIYAISATAQNGDVTGTGSYPAGETATLTAVPSTGYEFSQWSDGVTTASRSVLVDDNKAFVAEFKPLVYTITTVAENGTITGGGRCNYDSEVELVAVANTGYKFKQWTDGVETAKRTVKVTGDATYTAEFEMLVLTVTLTEPENGSVTGGGSFNYGTEITLKATAADGYKFVRWTDNAEGSENRIRLYTVTEDVTMTAVFTERNNVIYKITVAAEHGTVNGAGSYAGNEEITLTAIPERGYKFVGWTDGDKNATRTITVTQDKLYTAEFELETYTVTVVAQNGTVTGADDYEFGSTATLKATANTGYQFSGWSDGNTDNPRSVTVEDNVTYTAEFAPIMYTITTKAENGSVNGGGSAAYNSTVILEAVAAQGYQFKQWSDGVKTASRTITVTQDATYTAEFEKVTALTITIVAENGKVDGVKTSYAYNELATLTAVANSHYHFVCWNDSVTTASRSVTVNVNMTLTAIFAIDRHKITVVAENGTVTGAGEYDYGKEVTLTATANSGYKFVRWSDSVTTATRTIKVEADVNLTAIFVTEDAKEFKVTLTAENGTVEGSGTYFEGDTVIIKATANEDFKFVKWSDDNTDNPRTLVVTGDVILSAIFESTIEVTFTVTTIANNGTVTGAGIYHKGDTAIFTATANKGYKFVGWSDGNTDNPRIVIVTEDMTMEAKFEKDGNSAVSDDAANAVNIFAYSNVIVVENADAEISVYNTMGGLVYKEQGNGVNNQIVVNGAGIYIVKVGNVAKRVVIN